MQTIHIDTDLGGDIDDLCALAMVLKWPDANLIGVTTVAEHGGKRAAYVRYVLDLAGRNEIPVAAGAEATLPGYRIWQGLPNESAYWPETAPPEPSAPDEALNLLEQSIDQGATVVAIGPYTNLALLEQRTPGILRQAKLCLMGGYVYAPETGYPKWGHEIDFNVQVDLQSAHYIIERSDPTFVPLAMTVKTALRRAHLPALRESDSVARLIAHQAELFAVDEQFEEQFGRTCSGLPADIINFQHDSLACAIALGWADGVEIREIPLRSEVVDGWLTHSIVESGKPTRVVTQIDGEQFNHLWLQIVTGD